MIITTYLPASDFLARTRAELERNKVLNSLSLGITLRLQKSPERVEISLYLATEAISHSCTLTELDVSYVPAGSELDASPPHCKMNWSNALARSVTGNNAPRDDGARLQGWWYEAQFG